jgi:hypothetical protein
MTTKIKFEGDPSLYEEIDALPMIALASMQKVAAKTPADNASLMTETVVNGLKEKFEECMRAEFNAVNKFVFCTHDSDLAMIFGLKREYVHDAFKVNVSLCVKKKFGSKPVAKAETLDAAKQLYLLAFRVLNHPTIQSMTKTRDIENEVYVQEPLWKKVKDKGDHVDADKILQAALDSAKASKIQELKTALKKEVCSELKQNGAASFEPVIEDIIDSTDMTNFLKGTSLYNDPVKTLELMRTKMEKHLAARPDAAGKSMQELAHLEIMESLKRHRERMHANAQKGAAGAKEKKE